ncbi:MAG: Bax inhibitor-1/YccA family protein [Chloroflexota bacterium]
MQSWEQGQLAYARSVSAERRGALVGQVFGLLGFAMVFTAGGAFVGTLLGPGAMILSIIGGLGTLLALTFLRARMSSGAALGLFYAFSVFQGMALGLLIDMYLQRGMGRVVVNAAGTTAVLTLALSAYAWTTKRDLSGMGSYLMAGLIGVLVAGLVGMVLSLFGIPLGIFAFLLSAATAILFSGYIMYDMQRLKYANAESDDAIMLAIGIYLSIYNLFVAILQMFGFLGGGDED